MNNSKRMFKINPKDLAVALLMETYFFINIYRVQDNCRFSCSIRRPRRNVSTQPNHAHWRQNEKAKKKALSLHYDCPIYICQASYEQARGLRILCLSVTSMTSIRPRMVDYATLFGHLLPNVPPCTPVPVGK